MSGHESAKTILLFANTGWYLYNFRLSLAHAIREAGYHPVLASPMDNYVAKLQDDGFEWFPLEITRRGVNPIIESASILRIFLLYRKLRPTILHHFTIKPVIYGSLAARIAGIPAVVNSVTGLGYLFGEGNLRRGFLQRIIQFPYRIALSGYNTRVIFQNQSDLDKLRSLGLIRDDKAVIIPGSGVDITRFRPTPEPPGPPVVVLIARMLWDKGIGELIAAVRLLRNQGIIVHARLVGAPDPGNPTSIPVNQIEAWVDEGLIEWMGHQDDIPSIIASAHIIVLPSYSEGIPRSLIEAAASGKPIIASDIPGCREVVKPGVNGLLIPPHDPVALADALADLISDPLRRQMMGQEGRKIAVGRLSASRIASQTLDVYHSLLKENEQHAIQ